MYTQTLFQSIQLLLVYSGGVISMYLLEDSYLDKTMLLIKARKVDI